LSSACRVDLVASSYVRSWHTKLREVLRCQAVKALIHRGAQFEGDMLWNIQPVQFIVEDVRQTPIKLLRISNDSGSGVQDALQLVSRSARRVREQAWSSRIISMNQTRLLDHVEKINFDGVRFLHSMKL